jgi:hypothetical protein
MLAVPALPAGAAAQTAAPPASSATERTVALEFKAPDAVGSGGRRFLTEAQFAALEKLCDAIVPAGGNRPSAREAAAPEFLDFLVRESPADIKELYREGLDRLAREGISEATLAPLRQAWTYAGPADPFARFLQMAKENIFRATINSREFSEATSRGRRGAAGLNYYWRSLE